MQIRKHPSPTCDDSEETEAVPKDEARSYYYDDAHGYEDFDPEELDEEELE